MKIAAIGDIHGRDIWKDIVECNNFDHIVFIGDYFDSKKDEKISPKDQIDNFRSIIEFKKSALDRVTLLLGNHEFHYLPGSYEYSSGFNSLYKGTIQYHITSALDEGLIQIAKHIEGILFTHAGVTKSWMRNNKLDSNNVPKSINELFCKNKKAFSHVGSGIDESPIRVRPTDIEKDALDLVQVFGHSPRDTIDISDDGKRICIDTLGRSKQFLEIYNRIPYPRNIRM